MMIILGIIVSIIVFSIIVLLHEYGHFKSARIFGVKVEEFGLGIPPKARKIFTDKHGTDYTLNWLPLGGFVKLKGENIHTFQIYDEKKNLLNNAQIEEKIIQNESIFDKDSQKIPETFHSEILTKLQDNYSNDSLLTKPYYQQAIIVLAGIFMNFLLAWVIFSILFFVGVSPIGINNKIKTSLPLKIIPTQEQAIKEGILQINSGVILYPVEGSIAEKAGIKQGDVLYSIITCEKDVLDFVECKGDEKTKGYEINSPEDAMRAISGNAGKEVAFYVNQIFLDEEKTNPAGGAFIKVGISEEGKIGSYLAENIEVNRDFKYSFGVIDSIKYGAIETYGQITLTFKGLKMLFQKIFAPNTPTERQEAIDQVSGPIGMVDFMTKSISNGIIFILILGAIISINLGVFNLLPIPALDGGRFVFIIINGTIQKIFGKKAINERLEGSMHVLFFLFLIALSVIIAYNDITKIINN